MKTVKLFYIQNKGFVGNCLLWWRPNGSGYTCNLDEAWKVSKEEAVRICKTRRGEDIAHRADVIDRLAIRHVTQLPVKKAKVSGER